MTRLAERITKLREVAGGSKNCGWVSDEVGLMIYALVKFFRPDLTIQTGHLWGKSALFVLEALTDGSGLFEDPRLNPDKAFGAYVDAHRPHSVAPLFYSIDPAPQSYAHGLEGIALLNEWYPGTFKFFHMKSAEFFLGEGPSLAAQFSGKSVMTIVDGDHSEAGCRGDLEASAAMGARLIFVDDIDFVPHIGATAIEFAGTHSYHYVPLHQYNGVGILARN